ncbi:MULTISPECIES: DUF2975 domain-containing protein [Ensifer]|jgi:hypothetical protein|uniref:DUF2975 domain-containing protein n=1 Tax=Ensifer canadensis TaxID=555315 RepID=A0AAW4FKD3_9HYPH|nr:MULTISPECIES: DUF2975 domain-containing protein [Ensifer]MDP9628563.1 hypothetical protein [Ensifer adhaerens]KQU98229.1 hypothetical protein ASD00_00785 [Ensifer sp. Root31]KQW85004.1 hypothetical protein ASD03_04620 [Ensifer sp. Root127]KQY71236.1 hypothetical protein ASD52_05965 [Ensifer sp. Root142]MBD9486020.1 DUF2975 domain-containing protein [Ensifer sp. ENS11]
MNGSPERLRKLSRIMKLMVVLCGAVFCSAVVYGHWQIFFDRAGFEQGIRDVVFPKVSAITLSYRAIITVMFLTAMNNALVIAGLAFAWQLFDGFERGEILSSRNGVLLKRIGIIAIVGSLCMTVSNAIGIMAVTYDNPSTTGHSVFIDINGGTIIVMLMAGLLLVLGHVMVIASGIEAENRSFV